jgi:hypothetical protein
MTSNLYEASDSINTLYENIKIPSTGVKEPKLFLYGTAIVCDRPGINGRSYPSSILKREMDRYIGKYINNGRSFAELNHPRLTADGEGKDYSVFEINLFKACCMIVDLHFEKNEMKCKMKVVDKHPAGIALKALIDDGLRPGYSLRGAGSVIDTGRGFYEVDKDYRMITIDVVGNPSFDDDAIIDSLYESIKGGKMNVLTESAHALEMAQIDFMSGINNSVNKSIVGRKQIQKIVLENYCKQLIAVSV